jgi:hypothetical protein
VVAAPAAVVAAPAAVVAAPAAVVAAPAAVVAAPAAVVAAPAAPEVVAPPPTEAALEDAPEDAAAVDAPVAALVDPSVDEPATVVVEMLQRGVVSMKDDFSMQFQSSYLADAFDAAASAPVVVNITFEVVEATDPMVVLAESTIVVV